MQNIVNFKGTSYLWIVKDYTQFMKNNSPQRETKNFFVDRTSIFHIQMLRTCFIRVELRINPSSHKCVYDKYSDS